jgi:aminoglycoside phosphotransferase (APT) family kinase protein
MTTLSKRQVPWTLRYLYTMEAMADAPPLARVLARLPQWRDVDAAALEKLPDKGLAHAHWRIGGKGLLVRVPRAPDRDGFLLRQAACFERLAPCGRAPRLHAVIDPCAELPGGALVVDEIGGRPPRWPAELSLVAETLAAIHALPLPPPEQRPPLPDPPDPFVATLKIAEGNRPFLEKAGAGAGAARQIDEELAWARAFAANRVPVDAQRSFVVADAHPGNFVITPAGQAMFVDLEKGGYGAPAIDVAHATLRPSTRWDPECGTILKRDEIARFARAYFMAAGLAREQAMRPTLIPMRRLTWLRTTLAFARFKVERTALALSGPAAAHAEAVIADSLSEATIADIRSEWLGPDPLTF